MEVFKYFSQNIQDALFSNILEDLFPKIEEIRLRIGNKIMVKLESDEIIIDYIVLTEDLLKTIDKITENSIYTYQNQICNGFITVKGGHRVGLSGNVAIENQKIVNIVHVYSLNFRIARQVLNCSDFLLENIYKENGVIYNTLILGSPGSGKTTILRDLVRNISDGNYLSKGVTVGVIDERSEISAMYRGIPQTSLGLRTDILENVPKVIGIKMMIRSMAPKVIAVDEIGGIDDARSINYAMCSGVKGIFTAHGESFRDLKGNPELKNLVDMKIIEKILVLSNRKKGELVKSYYLDKKSCEYREF